MGHQGYCVKCNRGRKKGEWKPVELVDEKIETRERWSRKQRVKIRYKLLRGRCPKCNTPVTVIIGK